MRKSHFDKDLEDLEPAKIKTKKERNISHLFEGQKEAIRLQTSGRRESGMKTDRKVDKSHLEFWIPQ